MKFKKFLLGIIFLIYILFIYSDTFNIGTSMLLNIIKYIGILLCFIISSLGNKKYKLRDTRLLQLGMFFTIIADLFLVILENYIVGIIAFSIVQLVYIVRYTGERVNVILKKLFIVFVLIFSIYVIITKFIIKPEFILVALGLFYSILLIVSVYKSVLLINNKSYLNPNKYMIAWGMGLFLLCDFSIGISYILRVFKIFDIANIFSNMIWILYLPSQVLLALSGNSQVNI